LISGAYTVLVQTQGRSIEIADVPENKLSMKDLERFIVIFYRLKKKNKSDQGT
jgi:hypothetical protein